MEQPDAVEKKGGHFLNNTTRPQEAIAAVNILGCFAQKQRIWAWALIAEQEAARPRLILRHRPVPKKTTRHGPISDKLDEDPIASGSPAGPIPAAQLARISHRLTVEARDRSAITSLRLLAVLTVLCKCASLIEWGSLSGARLVLTRLSRAAPRHAVRKAG